MKIILPFLMIPVFCFSQSAADRQKIVATYDQNAVSRLKQEAKEYMAEQKKQIEAYKATHRVEESELHSLQRMHNGIPIFFTTFNDGSSKTIRANSMYPGGVLGLNVIGTGMVPGVWDGGKVRSTHNEFPDGKVSLDDAATDLSAHATHVTGTIVAAGVSPTRRGIAYGAIALTHDWDDDYVEMVSFGSEGYLVSNHSYGYNTESLPNWEFGSYDDSAIEIDQLSNAYPLYQIVIAAGNDRNSDLEQNSLKGGYDLISGTACSKNGITVAAVDQLLNYSGPESVVMSDFSNYGPTDDGRIKPDIAAKGVNTSSCVSSADYAYDVYSGTSMAAPAITGLITLLQNHYNNLNGSYMRASTVRGLICHSAREAGYWIGPDYEYGWGLADGLAAANIISNRGVSTVLEENTLANGETFTKSISINAAQRLSATICWTDPTGVTNGSANDNHVARLRNNLDLKILKDGEIYHPWKLDVENPTYEATREDDNNVDNIERVDIDLAEPGVYTIQVTNKGTLLGGSQVFSLIANGATSGLGVNQADFRDNIVLYPNPAKTTLNFAAPENIVISSVTVFDILGKQVNLNTELMNNAIDISNLSSGIYFAKFMAGGQSAVRKFVKE